MNILITGGASGLGEAITRALALDRSNTIFITYSHSSEKGQLMEREFDNVNSLKCDFTNSTEVTSLVNNIRRMNIDALVNNAYSNSCIKTYFNKVPAESFALDFTNNIIPTIRITQEVITEFRRKKSGKIITILTSGLVNTPPLGWSCYTANKAYLASLVKSWAIENIKYNISSNSVSPAFMQTNLTSDVDERIIDQMIVNHPLKKILTVAEVSETIKYLINGSSQINGVDILLNSGVNVK